MRSRTNQLYIAVAFLFTICAMPASALGRSTAADYADRLAQAERMVNEALQRNSPVSELASITTEIKRLLPASEEVEFIGAIIRVDNGWLHEAVDNVVKNGEDAAGHRLPMLGEISARLARLRQSVKAGQMEEDG